jgi:U3 small nucleolar RNA-associated protein 3
MAKGKGQSKKRPAVEKKYDGGGSRVNAANTWDDMEHDSEDDCKFLFTSIVCHVTR